MLEVTPIPRVASAWVPCSSCNHQCLPRRQGRDRPDSERPLRPSSPCTGLPCGSWGLLERPGQEPALLGPLNGRVSAEDFPLQKVQLAAATLSIASWLPWKHVSRGICFSLSLNEEEYRASRRAEPPPPWPGGGLA